MAAEKPHSHVPYGSDGSGYYSDNTIGCYNVVKEATPIVMDALDRISLSSGKCFTICDYGTADGGTSMFLLRDVIKKLKERNGEDQQVLVVYEDQPVNDFKSLFMRIHGLIPGPPSYFLEFSNVFISACGTGFYSQCLPNDSVHLGFSSTAFHWLSESPCEIDDALHHVLSKNEEIKKKYREQAAKDWERVMLHRAAELSPGGQLVVLCFCVDEDGNYLGKSPHVKYSMYDQMTECWREMLDEGKITEEEHRAAHFNNYYRSVGEYQAVFRPGTAVHSAGLRLVSINTQLVRCPYNVKWREQSEHTDDPEAARRHARWFIPTTRTWSNYTFLSSLNNSRTEQERADLVDQFYLKYEDRVTSDPAEHAMDYAHAYIHVEKVQGHETQ